MAEASSQTSRSSLPHATERASAAAGSAPGAPGAPGVRLAMVGASFRRLGFERLAGLVLPAEDGEALRALARAAGALEAVYLGTCNRVELYVALPASAPAEQLAGRVAAFFGAHGAGRESGVAPTAADLDLRVGADAVGHLFRVACSLESLVLGEHEILGQVRRAAERARAAGIAGERLGGLFREAQRVAALVREETAIGRTPVSIASLASRAIRDHFGGAPIERALFLGVGDMTRKVAQTLEGKADLVFVNRTLARAEELAARLGGRALSLDAFRSAPLAELDVLVTATSAREPVIGPRELAPALAARRAGRPALLVCDLGLPPDVDPALTTAPGLRRVALADLDPIARENQRRLEGEAARAQALVERESARYGRRLTLRAEAESSLEALLGERLAHLTEDDRRTLRRFAGRLAERLASI